MKKMISIPVEINCSWLEISTLVSFTGMMMQKYPDETIDIIDLLSTSDIPPDMRILLKIVETIQKHRELIEAKATSERVN